MVSASAGPSASIHIIAALAAWTVAITACAEVETVDDSGHSVRLAQPARRIVSLAPHLTELLFEAGAGHAIVATAAYSDRPPAARTIPRAGDAHALDLERIVALRPDLVVAWASGSPRRQVARLRALGYPIFHNESATLEAIATTIERLGVLAGTSAIAHERAARYRFELARLRAEHAQDTPVRVFYQVADHPLLTVSSRHVIADALRVCGAQNIFARDRTWLPRPSREAVLLADPDAIVVAGRSVEDPAELDAWRRWPRLRAVSGGRLYVVDPNVLHRATPSILEGVAKLCEHIAAARGG
jgi:iron complex transport system substrate-binding protein